MVEEIESLPMPPWLESITPEAIQTEPFPLMSVLNDSLYYPASGFDGDPVMLLMGNTYSFIYVDYGFTEGELEVELNRHPFRGYGIVGRKNISEEELSPARWTLMPLESGDGNPSLYRSTGWIKRPFALWMVFERCKDYDESHNPKRFSLMHLCADGVATYQALYTSNRTKPRILAVIQPGTGFGKNWTDFRDPRGIFAGCVHGNPAGVPRYLIEDGIELRERAPMWPDYSVLIGCNWFGTSRHLALWEQK